MDRKISSLYPRKRNSFETSAIKKINEEYFKQGKLINAFKFVIQITVEIRNLIHRLSGELKNLENIYNGLKPLQNSDFDILREIKASMEILLDKLENLRLSKKEDLNNEILNLMNRLNHVLSNCDATADKIIKIETEKYEKNFLSDSIGQVESNRLIIKDIHDELIQYFQGLFSKNI
jgi:hypothetical protein